MTIILARRIFEIYQTIVYNMVNRRKWCGIFNYDINNDLGKLGGIQQAEKEFDENVLEIKNLLKKIGNLSNITFKHKNFFCTMKSIILVTYSIQNWTKNSKYKV